MLEDNEETPVDTQFLELVIVNPLRTNQQVYNTYGQLSNTELLNRYGFIEHNNPYSYIDVSREDILSCLDGVDDRIGFWDQVGNDIVQQIEEIDVEGVVEMTRKRQSVILVVILMITIMVMVVVAMKKITMIILIKMGM
jgi:hypothetical protein